MQLFHHGFEIRDHLRFQLRGGDQLLLFPGETLDTAGTPEEKGHLYWITLRMQPINAPLFFLERKAAPS